MQSSTNGRMTNSKYILKVLFLNSGFQRLLRLGDVQLPQAIFHSLYIRILLKQLGSFFKFPK